MSAQGKASRRKPQSDALGRRQMRRLRPVKGTTILQGMDTGDSGSRHAFNSQDAPLSFDRPAIDASAWCKLLSRFIKLFFQLAGHPYTTRSLGVLNYPRSVPPPRTFVSDVVHGSICLGLLVIGLRFHNHRLPCRVGRRIGLREPRVCL